MPNDISILRLLRIAQTRLGLADARPRRWLERIGSKCTRLMMELTEQLNGHADDPEIRWRMAQLAVEAGSMLVAARCFEACLALNPNYRPARDGLAALKAAHPELARSPSAAALRPGAGMSPLLRESHPWLTRRPAMRSPDRDHLGSWRVPCDEPGCSSD